EPRSRLQRAVAELLHAGGDLEADVQPRREHVQQAAGHVGPRRDIGVDQRLEPLVDAHAANGASPVHGRTCSNAAPIRNAVTSSYVRATIWMPVGTPLEGATPLGTASTGHGARM